MVFALAKLREERRRGRAEGLAEGRAAGLAEGREKARETMAQTMREIGISETEIQQTLDRFDNLRNGERER